MSYWGTNFPEPAGGGGGGGDTVPPTITIVSPSIPSGFPADWSLAKDVPVVLNVTDAAPGIEYITVTVFFSGGQEETVYRRGSFRGDYAGLSTQSTITNGLQLSVRRNDGWPPGSMTFNVDALDGDGNLAP
jgi:hypothetical protein